MTKPINKKVREYFAGEGRKGGNATLKKHGPAYYKELSRKGVEARKKNK